MYEKGTNCPYCGGKMTAGKILGDRYALKWIDAGQKLTMGIFAPTDSIVLSDQKQVGRPAVNGLICKTCKKIIIDY